MDEIIHIHGDGQQTRCYTHVEDVANGILCILESKQTGVLNIAGEEEVSVLKLIEVLAGLLIKRLASNLLTTGSVKSVGVIFPPIAFADCAGPQNLHSNKDFVLV